jgi:hypothetical protein
MVESTLRKISTRTIIGLSVIGALSLCSFTINENNCTDCAAFKPGFYCTNASYSADGALQREIVIKTDSVGYRHDTLYSYGSIRPVNSDDPETIAFVQWCVNGNYAIDIAGTFSATPESADKIAAYEVVPLLFPLEMKKGDSLGNASLKVSIREDWGLSNVLMKWTERICLGDDTVQVQGKTYTAYKVQSVSLFTLKKGPVTMVNAESRQVDWFSPLYGALKTEIYSEGKLSTTRRVTAIHMPQ